VSNWNCEVQFIETEKQLANIFTKSLPNDMFFLLRNELDILDSHIFFLKCCFYHLSYFICEDKQGKTYLVLVLYCYCIILALNLV